MYSLTNHTISSYKYEKILPRLVHIEDSSLLAHILRFQTQLFIYGDKPGPDCLEFLCCVLEWKPRDLLPIVPLAIALMDADALLQFQQRVSKMISDKPGLIVSVNFCKSLKEQCRSVLYSNIRHRNMAAHVNLLPLPIVIKDFLLFK